MAQEQLHLFVKTPAVPLPAPDPPQSIPVPGARSGRSDPVSSVLAAEEFAKSGNLAKHQAIVLAGIQKTPGGTGAEIAEAVPELTELQTLRRLSELADAGLIRRGELRCCRIKGRRCISWWPMEAEGRE